MLGPAGAIRWVVDLLGVGRMASLMPRFARLSAVLVCGVIALLTFGVVSASGDMWTVEGGTHYLETDLGELIKSWTAKEWQVWRKEAQSVGECMGVEEHCAAHERAGETPLEDLPRV